MLCVAVLRSDMGKLSQLAPIMESAVTPTEPAAAGSEGQGNTSNEAKTSNEASRWKGVVKFYGFIFIIVCTLWVELLLSHILRGIINLILLATGRSE